MRRCKTVCYRLGSHLVNFLRGSFSHYIFSVFLRLEIFNIPFAPTQRYLFSYLNVIFLRHFKTAWTNTPTLQLSCYANVCWCQDLSEALRTKIVGITNVLRKDKKHSFPVTTNWGMYVFIAVNNPVVSITMNYFV